MNDPREIVLTQGQRAIVDEDDYERLIAMGPWCATKRKSPKSGRFLGFYASRTVYCPSKRTVYMHCVIAGKNRVGFLNRNTLDLRKRNLIDTDSRLIQASRLKKRDWKGSPYKGVRKANGGSRWEARISSNGVLSVIGYFDSPEEAAKAYDLLAKEFFGVNARLNFPLEA